MINIVDVIKNICCEKGKVVVDYSAITWWFKQFWSVSRIPGFNPRSRHTKDFKIVIDASLLSTQQYKVLIEGKVEQSRERSCTLPYSLV